MNGAPLIYMTMLREVVGETWMDLASGKHWTSGESGQGKEATLALDVATFNKTHVIVSDQYESITWTSSEWQT